MKRIVRSCLNAVAVAGLLLGVARPASGQPAAPPSKAPPSDAKLDLFLLVGQSNMAGRGTIEAQDRVADPRVWTLNEAGEWVAAVDPLHFDKNKKNGVGLGRTFGVRVAATAKDRGDVAHVGLIPCAVGGVSIDQWKVGGKLYADAVRRGKIALKHGRLAGILWHQGESDTKPEKVAKYAAKLDTIVAAFRKELNAPDAPLVVGRLGVFDPVKNAPRVGFNEMITQYAADRPGTGLVDAAGLSSVGDNTHFDAASQRELGRRYAEAFLKLKRPTTRPDRTKKE